MPPVCEQEAAAVDLLHDDDGAVRAHEQVLVFRESAAAQPRDNYERVASARYAVVGVVLVGVAVWRWRRMYVVAAIAMVVLLFLFKSESVVWS